MQDERPRRPLLHVLVVAATLVLLVCPTFLFSVACVCVENVGRLWGANFFQAEAWGAAPGPAEAATADSFSQTFGKVLRGIELAGVCLDVLSNEGLALHGDRSELVPVEPFLG